MSDDYSNNLLKLNCRKFNLTVHEKLTPTIGLLEEELVDYYPEVVPLNSFGMPYTINYELMTVLLLHQVQQLGKTNSNLGRK